MEGWPSPLISRQLKRVPGHASMDEVDNSDKLGDVEASKYKSGLGILLYLASDLPHAQHAIRR